MSASIKLRFIDAEGVTERSKRFSMSDDSSTVAVSMQKALDSLECPSLHSQLNMYGQNSIRVRATTPTSMASALPPAVPTSMAAALHQSTQAAMAAPPPPYGRVLMDDGSAEPSTSAVAYTFYISKNQSVNDFHGSKLNMDGRNFYESNQGASWIMSVCRHPLYSMAENIRRLVPAFMKKLKSVNTWLARFSQKSASERVSPLDASNDNGIIFPTILILGSQSAVIFYIAADVSSLDASNDA
uniref:Uncharacterized protein n=1 Tax=Panagrolaimus davidi TaxID=227884 RepID=A0A914PXE9_9BILA